MSWELVKRHRRKIATVATAVGGVYVVKKVLNQQKINVFDWLQGSNTDDSQQENNSKLIASKKAYIFDSHQQTCDKQVQETVDAIAAHLKSRFEPAPLIEKLTADRALPKDQRLSKDEQLEVWQTIKLKTFAQIMAVAFAHAIVMLALKIQKSLICRESIRRFIAPSQQSYNLVSYVTSWFTSPSDEGAKHAADAKAQQVFLNCIQYLTTHGLDALYDSIEECATTVMGTITLTSVYDAAAIRAILDKLQQQVEQRCGGDANFAKFVVPTADLSASSADYNALHLSELLEQLSTQLEAENVQAMISRFVEHYIAHTASFIVDDTSFFEGALPKWLPALDRAAAELQRTSDGSAFHHNLCTPELYRLCKQVFTSA